MSVYTTDIKVYKTRWHYNQKLITYTNESVVGIPITLNTSGILSGLCSNIFIGR